MTVPLEWRKSFFHCRRFNIVSCLLVCCLLVSTTTTTVLAQKTWRSRKNVLCFQQHAVVKSRQQKWEKSDIRSSSCGKPFASNELYSTRQQNRVRTRDHRSKRRRKIIAESNEIENRTVQSKLVTSRRRAVCQLLISGGATFMIENTSNNSFFCQSALAAETIGKDPNCDDPSCLGIWDGLFADCPHDTSIFMNSGAGCTSSQDDTPGIFSEPWDYSDLGSLEWEDQMRLLKSSISLASSKRGDQVAFLLEEGRYLRTQFVDGKTGETSIGEFYFTPNDTTVQFRVASMIGQGSTTRRIALGQSSKSNIDRCEDIRKQARYTKVPVLRNRRRTLFFGESQLDTFGPGSASLGPPAEMSTGDIEGRQDLNTCDTNGLNCLPFGIKLK